MIMQLLAMPMTVLAMAGSVSLPGETIAPERRIDWSKAGAERVADDRTTICATIQPGAGAAAINAAIQNCPENQVVYLSAGTYSIAAPGITFGDRSNVTLRGAGPDSTILKFTGMNGCGGLNASICVPNGSLNYYGSPGNTASWIAGYAKGSTVITLSRTDNLKIGAQLILDQINDSNIDTGEVWVCGTGGLNECCVQCASGVGRSGRQQTQVVKVTGIQGNQVTIADPVFMPQWRAGQSPEAWWSSDTSISGVGIEDLSVDHSGSGGTTGIGFYNATGCWVKNVRSVNSNRSHLWLYQSSHVTVRSSYFFGTKNASSQSYGIEQFTASSNLVENNIFQHIYAPLMSNNCQGTVYGYNYTVDNYTGSTIMAASAWHHGPGVSYSLYEGNEGQSFRADYFHGLSHFNTLFRNWLHGWESGKDQLTIPVYLQMGHRYFNVVGNVLGTAGYHVNYASVAGGSADNCHRSIYALGWGGYCGSGSLNDDTRVAGTLLRWGNFDTVSNSIQWVPSEVPSGLDRYANPVPGTQELPKSLYLSAQPSWWASRWNRPRWPAIGPDVEGAPGPGGHAEYIPARSCYENAAKDPAYGALNVLLFDARDCYAPSAPRNLSIQTP